MGQAAAFGGPELHQARVLIVEDEPFIALDLAQAVEDAGGEPLGPAATIRQALAIIAEDGVKAAILDVNLPDGHIGPVLEALGRDIPIVVHTGVGLPPEVKARFPGVPVYLKPTPPTVLARRIATELRQ